MARNLTRKEMAVQNLFSDIFSDIHPEDVQILNTKKIVVVSESFPSIPENGFGSLNDKKVQEGGTP